MATNGNVRAIVGIIVFLVATATLVKPLAAARLYFSRRGPSVDGCPGPRIGDPMFMHFGGRMHAWLNVDDLPDTTKIRDISWSLEVARSEGLFLSASGHILTNPENPAEITPRWSTTNNGLPAESPYLFRNASVAAHSDNPGIGTTPAARADPLYDVASNSFYLGELEFYPSGGGSDALFLRVGDAGAHFADGAPVPLQFGRGNETYLGNQPGAGRAITARNQADAYALAYGAPSPPPFRLAVPGSFDNVYFPEFAVDAGNGATNVAFCPSGVNFGAVEIRNHMATQVDVYLDFAGTPLAEWEIDLIRGLVNTFEGEPTTVTDVKGAFPLGNGVDYDVQLSFPKFAPNHHVLNFEFETGQWRSVSNVGIVPEPTALTLALSTILSVVLKVVSQRSRQRRARR